MQTPELLQKLYEMSSAKKESEWTLKAHVQQVSISNIYTNCVA